MRPKVLMACIHPYTSTFQVGSQHIARQFIKNGYDVAYVSAPLSPFHIFKKHDLELYKRFKIYKKGGEYRIGKRLWQYVPFSLFTPSNKPFLNTAFVLYNWKNACLPDLKKRLASVGYAEVDIFYFDNLLAFPLLKDVKCKTSVFRIMDNHSGFPGYPRVAKNLTNSIRGSVDIVAYSAISLKSYAQNFCDNTAIYIPNGIDFDTFVSGPRDIPAEIRHIKRPIAVYVGAIEAWFDSELLAYAASKLTDISFLIIGPKKNVDPKLKDVKNIHMIGPVDHSDLQRYLYNCDVGLIPFNKRKYPELINNVNPLKLYEYMACGLPVVATEWQELKLIGSPAVLCDTIQKFTEAIVRATKNTNYRDRFTDFAIKNSWDKNFSKLLSYLR